MATQTQPTTPNTTVPATPLEAAIAARVKTVGPRLRRLLEDSKEAFQVLKEGEITQDHIDTLAGSAKRFLVELSNSVTALDAAADAVETVAKIV